MGDHVRCKGTIHSVCTLAITGPKSLNSFVMHIKIIWNLNELLVSNRVLLECLSSIAHYLDEPLKENFRAHDFRVCNIQFHFAFTRTALPFALRVYCNWSWNIYICSPTRYTKFLLIEFYSSHMLAGHISDLTSPSLGAFYYKLYLQIWYVVIRVLPHL